MGYNPTNSITSLLTSGYPLDGDIIIFKIYDASKDIYYDAVPSEVLPWFYQATHNIGALTADPTILGCMDAAACNYDKYADENDDDQCEYVSCAGCTDEEACNYNSDATNDDGSCENAVVNHDCNGDCTAGQDCAGVCGGDDENDACGVCNGDNSTCSDCAGVPNGTALLDHCGICDSDISNDCTQDCMGVWGGSAVIDVCGVCTGTDNYVAGTCNDCNGVTNGTAYTDPFVTPLQSLHVPAT
jgi:hypothetical protein